MNRLAAGLLCGLALALAAGCSPKPGPDEAASVSIRFAIEVEPDMETPVFVVLNEEDSQVGWVTVFRDDQRVYLAERCEIENCGEPAVVCGMAFRMVLDIGSDAPVEFLWDVTTSRIEAPGCESRVAAAEGDYTARFCYSETAEFDGEAPDGPGWAVPGKLIEPTCVDRPFNLTDAEVVLRL